jgi:hypothetical protein
MSEAHPLVKRVAETLDLGDDDDLFGHTGDAAPASRRQGRATPASTDPADLELSYGDALRGLLGSTTAGSTG